MFNFPHSIILEMMAAQWHISAILNIFAAVIEKLKKMQCFCRCLFYFMFTWSHIVISDDLKQHFSSQLCNSKFDTQTES
jgi:hypothetical protein